jgi:hypothetical protein
VGVGVGGGVIVLDGELDFVGVMSFDEEPHESLGEYETLLVGEASSVVVFDAVGMAVSLNEAFSDKVPDGRSGVKDWLLLELSDRDFVTVCGSSDEVRVEDDDVESDVVFVGDWVDVRELLWNSVSLNVGDGVSVTVGVPEGFDWLLLWVPRSSEIVCVKLMEGFETVVSDECEEVGVADGVELIVADSSLDIEILLGVMDAEPLNETVFSDVADLGDNVGVGESVMFAVSVCDTSCVILGFVLDTLSDIVWVLVSMLVRLGSEWVAVEEGWDVEQLAVLVCDTTAMAPGVDESTTANAIIAAM